MTAALKSIEPDLRISALGGTGMEQSGVEMVANSSEIAVMGFSEVVATLPTLLRVRR